MKEKRAKIIPFITYKGGVAKTTSIINVGAYLSRGSALKKNNAYKILYVDHEPQANLTLFFSRFTKNEDLEKNNVLKGILEGKKINPIVINENEHLIASHIDLGLYHENEPEKLQTFLNHYVDDYDFIFLDCSPTQSIQNINVLKASDYIISPFTIGQFELQGMTRLIEHYKSLKPNFPNLNFLGFFASRFAPTHTLDKETYSAILDYSKDLLFNTKIRETTSLKQSNTNSNNIFDDNIGSTGAKDYRDLSNEIVHRLNPEVINRLNSIIQEKF